MGNERSASDGREKPDGDGRDAAGLFTETEIERYREALELAFGSCDPLEWAAELNHRLAISANNLAMAWAFKENPRRDIVDLTDQQIFASIRTAAGEYLSHIYQMLAAMPAIQQQPPILESLRFVVAAFTDIGRGASVDWLAPLQGKRHPKSLRKEAEWVPIVAALELLLMTESANSDSAARKWIASRTGRNESTVRAWHEKLYRKGQCSRPAAWQAIDSIVSEARIGAKFYPGQDRQKFIFKRISDLLA